MAEVKLPSNSHRARIEAEKKAEEPNKKEVQKVVSGKVVRKENKGRKLTDAIISDDVKHVKSYVVFEVLIPAFKKAISDIVTNGIDMILYGETGHTKKSGNLRSDYVSYRSYSDSSRERRYVDSRSDSDYDDLIFEHRGSAEDVLAHMEDILDEYHQVSIGDMYDLAGVTCDYTYNDYGWTSLRDAEVVRIRDGYYIKLPRAKALRR